MFRILLVCTGNTCRSPMAETLLTAKIRQSGLAGDIMVLSAGLAGEGSLPASYGAVQAMAGRGLDVSGHCSRQLLPDYIEAADLVLTMTKGHKQAVQRLIARNLDKVFTLAEFAGEHSDVDDPFGGDDAVYRQCADQLESLLAKSWEKILHLAGNKKQ